MTSHVKLHEALYLYAYGSLVWRPGELLQKFPSFRCKSIGWLRRFAQMSTDHRGHPSFPGLVATLVDGIWLSKENGLGCDDVNECFGVVYVIPADETAELLAEIDYRERGGYSRCNISVQLLEKTPYHFPGDMADALVYCASIENPHFRLLSNINDVAKIISAAVGPSGQNSEYLFQLCNYFHQQENCVDNYLFKLEFLVKRFLGPRRLQSRQATIRFNSNITSTIEYPYISIYNIDISVLPILLSICLPNGSYMLGWGSNSYHQISPLYSSHELSQSVIIANKNWLKYYNNNDDNNPIREISMTSIISTVATLQLDILNNLNLTYSDKNTNNEFYESNNILPWYQILCGGSHSAFFIQDFHYFLKHTESYIINILYILLNSVNDHNSMNYDAQNDHRSLLILWGSLDALHPLISPGKCVVIRGATFCSLGYAHSVIGLADGRLLCIGDNSKGQCNSSDRYNSNNNSCSGASNSNISSQFAFWPNLNDVCQQFPAAIFSPSHTVGLTSGGLRHSAWIRDGRLHTWGDHKYRQCLSEREADSSTEMLDTVGWGPPDGARLLDVGCGAKHTVVVDDRGRAWSLGDNKYGQLGRDAINVGSDDGIKREVPHLCEGLEEGVQWNKVVCGWSHTILRGVRQDGTFAFYGWGRCDLGQLATLPDEGVSVSGGCLVYPAAVRVRKPSPLPPLPAGNMAEVWCAAEGTWACCDQGRLWGVGWNEHSNMGTADKLYQMHWAPVLDMNMNEKQVTLTQIWEGAAACGGGHSIAIVHS